MTQCCLIVEDSLAGPLPATGLALSSLMFGGGRYSDHTISIKHTLTILNIVGLLLVFPLIHQCHHNSTYMHSSGKS